MPTFKTFWLVAISVVFYGYGWFCIFRTQRVVNYARRNYTKSKLMQVYPFAGYVMKPSYPIYIRIAGIFLWVWIAVVDYLVLTGWLR
jgi:hypothetical protein